MNWKERFDDKFKGNFPFEHWLYRDGNQKLDREIKLFIEQLISERDKEIIKIIKTPMSTEFEDPEEESADYSIEDFRAKLLKQITNK